MFEHFKDVFMFRKE